MSKYHVKAGDTVLVISGKDKGKKRQGNGSRSKGR